MENLPEEILCYLTIKEVQRKIFLKIKRVFFLPIIIKFMPTCYHIFNYIFIFNALWVFFWCTDVHTQMTVSPQKKGMWILNNQKAFISSFCLFEILVVNNWIFFMYPINFVITYMCSISFILQVIERLKLSACTVQHYKSNLGW